MDRSNILILWVIGLAILTYIILKEKPTTNSEHFINVGPQCNVSNKNERSKCSRDDDVLSKSKSCTSCSNEPLLPILEPLHNMREIVKQIILLEDHLFQKSKRCEDCICKHFLTIEALSEEAITLDKDKKHFDYLETLPDRVREIQKMYIAKKDTCEVAQELRNIRKEMMVKSFTFF